MSVEALTEAGLLTLQEAADRLGVTKKTLRHLMAKGKFPQPLRLSPRCVRVLESDFSDYIQGLIENRKRGR